MGVYMKKLQSNHTPELEALREMMAKLKRWDRKKFADKVKWLESKDKPDWMKNV